MNHKPIRIAAIVIIVICIFVIGVSAGIIIESFGTIAQQVKEIQSNAAKSDFLIALGGERHPNQKRQINYSSLSGKAGTFSTCILSTSLWMTTP